MPTFKLPDESKTQSVLLGICLAGLAMVMALLGMPALVFLLGASALLARPATFLLFGSLPVVVAVAARRLRDGLMWVILACVPVAAFTDLFLDWDRALEFLARASGSSADVAKANLGPPILVGYGLGFVAGYVALLTGVLWIRLRLAPLSNA